ncbi:MAG TPA: hypothetical protein VHW74_09255 [Mycobacteriales bacterium]|nr:hypothetical protein [Mycobacteriales bacterium]
MTESRTSSNNRAVNAMLAGGSILTVAALIAGIVVFIVGIHMHHTWAPRKAVCDSSLGQLGQAFNTDAESMCSHASSRLDIAWALIVAGVGLFIVGLKNIWLPITGILSAAKKI